MTYVVFVGTLNLTQLNSTRTLPIYFDFRRMGNKLPDFSRFPKLMTIGVFTTREKRVSSPLSATFGD